MQRKKVLSLVLTLAMVISLLTVIPHAASAAAGDYNVDDIMVINEIIANNGLNLTPDTNLDGAGYPGDWIGRVYWSATPNARIIELSINGRNLTGALDVSSLTALEYLGCYNNKLTSLNVSGLANLEFLHCSRNLLTSLNVSGLTNLVELSCDDNFLTSLNVSSLTNLAILVCDSNKLTSLNVNGLANLEILNCSENLLTSLDVSGLTSLMYFDCYDNFLTALNLSSNTALKSLFCYNNLLTSISLPGGTNLIDLFCWSNRLTSLPNLPSSLEYLDCYDNQLSSLPALPSGLIWLDCGSNQLASLPTLPAGLVELRCEDNRLTGFNVTGLNDLKELHCDGNYISVEELTAPGTHVIGVNNNPNFKAWDRDGFFFTPQRAPGDVPKDNVTNPPGGSGQPLVTVVIEEEETPLQSISSYAEELYKLGLFRGTGTDADGKPIFSLENPLTRLQALILTIRLLGLEEEALAYTGPNPFKDVTYSANVPYVAYAYSMGITKGVSATAFSPDRHVSCREFTTFLLRILGYSDDTGGDFEYLAALDMALSIEMYDEETLADIDSGVFLRGDAVIAMVRALLTPIKGSDETLLIDTLVEAEIFPQEAADEFIEAIARLS